MADTYKPAIAPEKFCKTARFATLDKLQKYIDGTQYDGKPDWFKAPEDTPLLDRKPCVIYALPKNAIDEATRFTFGEGRFPNVCVRAQDAEEAVGSFALSKDDAKLLESGIESLVKQSCLRSGMRALLRGGLGTKTAVAILCVRGGQFVVDMPHARDCLPVFAREGDPTSPVVALTWCYPFSKTVVNDQGDPVEKPFFFRRDITATEFIEYEPAADDPTKPIEWREKDRKPHGFSFCPVVWIRNLPNQHCSDIDGTSLIAGNLDEFDALNFALSKRHSGIHILGSPQPYETGVEQGDGPGAQPVKGGTPGWTGQSGSGAGAPVGAGRRTRGSARKSGPDRIWRYEGKDVKVGLLETTGASFDAASKHVDDITARVKQSMGVVLANVADVLGKGDMSAKFLALAYAPLLALVDELRECWWASGLRAIVEMMLRMVAETGGKGLLLPRAEKIAALLAKRKIVTTDGPVWVAPELDALWGPYFSASNDDINTAVTAAAAAKAAKLVPDKATTGFVADHFGVRDVDEALEELDDGSIPHDDGARKGEPPDPNDPNAAPPETPPQQPDESPPSNAAAAA